MALFPSTVCDCCCTIRVRSKMFACLACSYDFCADCMARGTHKGHPTIRITSPDHPYFHIRLQAQGRAPRVKDTFYLYERVTPMQGLDWMENRPLTPPLAEGETKKMSMEDLPFEGLGCNHCASNEIKHVVFTCTECPDFDLCAECEALGFHDKHPMIRFSNVGDPLFHARRDGANIMTIIKLK